MHVADKVTVRVTVSSVLVPDTSAEQLLIFTNVEGATPDTPAATKTTTISANDLRVEASA